MVRNNATGAGHRLLQWAFGIGLILMGADRFFHLLVDWDRYLAPRLRRPLGPNAHAFANAIGAVELLAGLLILLRPRLGGFLAAAVLLFNVISLLLIPGYFDVAVRDLLFALIALSIALLSPRR